jgi:autotransporter-associated beta strand protein
VTFDNTSGGAVTTNNTSIKIAAQDFVFAGTNDLDFGTGKFTQSTSGRLITANGNTGKTLALGTLENTVVTGVTTTNTTSFNAAVGGNTKITLRGINISNSSTNGIADLRPNATANVEVTGVIANGTGGATSGSLLLNGASGGVLTLSGANTYGGTGSTTTLNVAGVTLNINNDTALGTSKLVIAAAGTIGNTSNATRTLTNNNVQDWNANFTFAGPNDLNLGTGAVTMNASRTVTVSAGKLTVGGAIGQSSSGFTLTKSGTGALTLSGANTYTGATTVNDGILQLAKTSALYNSTTASWTAANIVVNNGATLALNVGGSGEFSTGNVTTLITNLNRAVNNNGLRTGSKIAFDTTNASGGSFTVADSIQNTTGTGGGTVGLTKLGTGALTLTVTNTYTGATTVSAGTLVVNGSISTSSLTTVASGATLGGSGTVGKTVINSGGTLAVGTSPGQMTFTDTLSLSGTTVMEIDGTAGPGVNPSGHDYINLTGSGAAGALTYGGTMTLDIGTIFGGGSYTWNLFDFASETGGFTGITLADQYSGTLSESTLGSGVWGLTSGDNTWSFTESSGVLGLTVVVVPEPRAALLGSLGMLMLLRRRR